MSMTIEQANTNRFLGRTKTEARPAPPADGVFGFGGRERLARDQAAWDEAHEWDQRNQRLREERIAAVNAKQAAERQARIDADEQRRTADLRRRYFQADPAASEADFQRDLPEIKRQARIQAAMTPPDDALARHAIDRRQYGI